ncbi:hypothetical protein PHLCEN_2v3713 [Hermanssonia centrifuga]|uniref:Uncharacterized protein n=1 Tax=Hermanssonia centrifuga TaxID=98765 RepID=A0A2R6QEH4_9APHY|nr:hypothetical protein PHLCEN_2v3713 [Hermanssonia centrifuga]
MSSTDNLNITVFTVFGAKERSVMIGVRNVAALWRYVIVTWKARFVSAVHEERLNLCKTPYGMSPRSKEEKRIIRYSFQNLDNDTYHGKRRSASGIKCEILNPRSYNAQKRPQGIHLKHCLAGDVHTGNRLY